MLNILLDCAGIDKEVAGLSPNVKLETVRLGTESNTEPEAGAFVFDPNEEAPAVCVVAVLNMEVVMVGVIIVSDVEPNNVVWGIAAARLENAVL